ncbi:autotransporter domain-containing protein [Iodidimonas sp. SYSU 1G8]|uniref:autotransporter domain-containing protein n=1 Tax=Iodidimonas sp. SYSU 1G8 TaxID=3133967 RepID=UPI0031FF04E1
MKRLDNKLKLSVSLLALMSGGALLASTAQAVTISDAQNSVVITTDASDLTVEETGDVSPGGILVQGGVDGDVLNDGSIEFVDSPIASDSNSVIADAVALEILGNVGGDVTNNGAMIATSDAGVSVISDFSDTIAIDEDSSSSAMSYATGLWLNTVDGDVTNNGDITATATADASSDISADSDLDSALGGGSYSEAEAYGVDVTLGEDSGFTNATDATIVADASASSDVVADVTGDNASLFDSEGGDAVQSYAYAYGVDLLGGGDIVNDGSIEAIAEASAVLDGTVTATAGSATLVDVTDSYAEATGVWSEGDIDVFDNTGTISATSTATSTATADAMATDGTATIIGENSAHAYAGGVDLDTTGAFLNDGDISADSAAVVDVDGIATGELGSAVSLGNFAEGESWGVYIEDLDGDFDNNGSISSVSSADVTAILDADSADTGTGVVSTGGGAIASAWGVQVQNLDGEFNNGADGEISADATASTSYDIAANGVSSGTLNETTTQANAVGVYVAGLSDGEEGDTDVNMITNAGTISATASATSDLITSSTAETTAGAGGISSYNGTGALAAGLLSEGNTTGFDNSGDISASATAASTVTQDVAGDDGAMGGSSNILYAAAIGTAFTSPVDGDIVNSGTIDATASGTLDIGMTATDPSETGSQNLGGVVAVGLYADVEAPSDDEDTANTFTNSGTISATGDLTIDVTQPTSSDTVGTFQQTYGVLGVAGAVVAGDASVIDNSGDITATGSLNTTGITGEDSLTAAAAIGLWLPEANDGLVVNNSGDITAELTGNADESVAVGLMLGPVPDGLLDGLIGGEGGLGDLPIGGILPGEGEGDDIQVLAAGVITVNNTGNISGNNETEGGYGYGIFAETAPVPVVINQMGGSISGSTAAIAMDQGAADVLNWSGGSISGLVDADSADVVNVIQNGENATTVTAGTDFVLEGAGQLNIGAEDAPVTFVMNGTVNNVGEANLNTDGTLVVGPTGEINVGTYNQDPDSTLIVQFGPTGGGLITTVGDANIDGNFQAQAVAGLYGDSGSYVVIDAGGAVVGEFDSIDNVGDTLLLDFTTEVNPSDVTVTWNRNAFDEVDGLSDNSASVAGALEDGYDPTRPPSGNTPELNDQIGGLFTLTDPVLYDRVLNSWSGAEHAQVMRAATNLSEPYLMALTEHLNDNRNTGFKQQRVVMLRPDGSSNSIAPASSVGQSGAEESGIAFWGRGFGRWTDVRGDLNAGGYEEDTYGAVLGMDFRVAPTVLLGVLGSYIDNDIDFDDGDFGSIRRWSVGGYASAQFDAFYLDGSFTYAKDKYRVDRTIITGGIANPLYDGTVGASSRYKGDGWIAHAETGFNWDLGESAKLQPFAGINYTSLDSDGVTETGAGDLGLNVLDGTGKSLQSRLGARLSGEWGSGDVVWVPELRGEWRHEFKDNPAWIEASLIGLPGQPFQTVGSKISRDLAVIGAGISAQFAGGWGLYVDYQGAFASGYKSHIAQAGVRVKF